MLKRSTAAIVAISTLMLSTIPADAAMMAYAYLKGQKSGQVKGSITQKGREDSIGVIAYDHLIKVPTDAASGAPTGKTQHGLFKFTKELDKSTPILFSAMTNNEVLSEAVFKFWTPQLKAAAGVGTEVQHFTVKLTNARIVDIRANMQNIRNPELTKYSEQEEVSLTYQKIEWTWNDGGITAAAEAQSRL
jgi:type VI secretion system secreted protein Hcp